MVEVDSVTKYYGELEAVRDVSFSMEKGEILGLLGPNAAGKTTLMRIITGFLTASDGAVRVAGHDVFEEPMAVKRRVGYLPEHPPLYLDMTVGSYLKFVAELKGVPRRERRERVNVAMDMVSISDISGRLIANISKGYRQRVGIAQALVNNPDVLILDEPTVGLDPEQIIEIRELIKRLGESHTIMLSSHILPEVSATCDRVVVLKQGRVLAVDTQEALGKRFAGAGALRVAFLEDNKQLVKELEKLEGVDRVARVADAKDAAAAVRLETRPGADVRAAVFECAVQNKWVIVGMKQEEVSLEDVFLKLTGGDGEADDDGAEGGGGDE